jgi:ubiquinone/menaquinone biosynthesis C-methylase UbiE
MPAVRFAEADVADLRFDSGSFDLAVANHLFNDLPDIVGPVGELARVLRPGGESQWWRENFPRPLFLLMTARKSG